MSVVLQLSASVDTTGWLDLASISDDISFDVKGAWAGGDRVIYCDTSLDPTKVTKSYVTSATYTANTPKPIGVRRLGAAYIRWRRGGTWGSSHVANIFAHGATNAEGKTTDLQVESRTYGAAQA